MSVVKAPPRTPVYMVFGVYGSLGGGFVHPRGRAWILADTTEADSVLRARIAYNSKTTGMVEYEDLGEIAQATIRGGKSAEIRLASGQVLTVVAAPCVCGAGAVGNAMPQTGRISLSYVNPHGLPAITVT